MGQLLCYTMSTRRRRPDEIPSLPLRFLPCVNTKDTCPCTEHRCMVRLQMRTEEQAAVYIITQCQKCKARNKMTCRSASTCLYQAVETVSRFLKGVHIFQGTSKPPIVAKKLENIANPEVSRILELHEAFYRRCYFWRLFRRKSCRYIGESLSSMSAKYHRT